MKTLWLSGLAVLTVGGIVMSGQSGKGQSSSWSGVIINSGCTVDEAFAEAPKCTNDVPGTKLVLYDDTTRQLFDLEGLTRWCDGRTAGYAPLESAVDTFDFYDQQGEVHARDYRP